MKLKMGVFAMHESSSFFEFRINHRFNQHDIPLKSKPISELLTIGIFLVTTSNILQSCNYVAKSFQC